MHITTLPGGDTIVANKDGIDQNMTGLFMAKGMIGDAAKKIGEALAKGRMAAQTPSGGAASLVQASAGRPPRPT